MPVSRVFEFPNNQYLTALFGAHDEFLKQIEEILHVSIRGRGNRYMIQSEDESSLDAAEKTLNHLYTHVQGGHKMTAEVIRSFAEQLAHFGGESPIVIKTRLKVISTRTRGQANYVKALQAQDIVIAIGPAGTGKTYLAVAMGVQRLLNNQVERLILTRPAVEAGEKLGFLPGDIREKVDPYLRPLYDALHEMMPSEYVQRLIANNVIEIAPLAFMRGRTLKNSYIILDEAQNTTPMQMKMFLTRIGEGSAMVICGDLTQTDLERGQVSGLKEATDVLQNLKEVAIIKLQSQDVVRRPLVQKIIQAYEKFDTV